MSGDVFLDLGVDPEDGQIDGERRPEGEVGDDPVVGPWQPEDLVSLLDHLLHVLDVGLGGLGGQDGANGVAAIIGGSAVRVVVVDAHHGSVMQWKEDMNKLISKIT